jgi:predicted Zn-dependent peptidase
MSVFERDDLGNGIRVLTAPLPHAQSTACFLMLSAGSRYEEPATNGLAHFVEHMLFKGTARRPSMRALTAEVDAIGGRMNASTSKDHTYYWVKSPPEQAPTGLDVLVDMLRNSLFDSEEIDRERKVISEEIKMDHDRPREYVEDVYETLLYGDHPLGRPILGSAETVDAMPREELLGYVERLYEPSRLVVGVAGRIDFDVRAELERLLGDVARPNGSVQPIPAPAEQRRSILIEPRDSEQAYFCLGTPAYPLEHPDRYVLQLIATVLGTGMSSRLNDELVSQRALAYFVFAATQGYTDCGALWAQTGVDVNRIEEAIEVVAKEFRRLVHEPVPPDELEKARNVAKGRFAFQLETPDGLIRFGLKREALESGAAEPQAAVDGLDAVTAEDVQRVAQELIGEEPLALAMIGPFDDSARFEQLVA